MGGVTPAFRRRRGRVILGDYWCRCLLAKVVWRHTVIVQVYSQIFVEKMEFLRILSPVTSNTVTPSLPLISPSLPLKAMVLAVSERVPPTMLLSAMRATPELALPRSPVPSLSVPMRLPRTALSVARALTISTP